MGRAYYNRSKIYAIKGEHLNFLGDFSRAANQDPSIIVDGDVIKYFSKIGIIECFKNNDKKRIMGFLPCVRDTILRK